MPLPDFIPYTDEELKEKQLGPYASGASAPSIAGANAPVQTPVAQPPEDLSQLELVPYTGDELVTAVEGDITKQLTFGEFEKYRRAKSLEPDKTWNQRMSEFGVEEVIIANPDGTYKIYNFEDVLPFSFEF